MGVNGRFMSTDCLPVTGKDGKTVWIFKLDDLKEVVSSEVYEVIEKFIQISSEDQVEEWLNDREKISESIEDGYLQMCLDARDDIEAVIKLIDETPKMTKKVKEEIRRKLSYVYRNLSDNL